MKEKTEIEIEIEQKSSEILEDDINNIANSLEDNIAILEAKRLELEQAKKEEAQLIEIKEKRNRELEENSVILDNELNDFKKKAEIIKESNKRLVQETQEINLQIRNAKLRHLNIKEENKNLLEHNKKIGEKRTVLKSMAQELESLEKVQRIITEETIIDLSSEGNNASIDMDVDVQNSEQEQE